MPTPQLVFLTSPDWQDYELLDSGAGFKLERFGPYRFVRPEHQAVWQRCLPAAQWEAVDGAFQATQEEFGGHWQLHKKIPATWRMRYKGLAFDVAAGNSRHLGVFPEQANHWDWIGQMIQSAQRPVRAAHSRAGRTKPSPGAQPVRLHRPGLPGSSPGWRGRHPRRCLEKDDRLGAPEPGRLQPGGPSHPLAGG